MKRVGENAKCGIALLQAKVHKGRDLDRREAHLNPPSTFRRETTREGKRRKGRKGRGSPCKLNMHVAAFCVGQQQHRKLICGIRFNEIPRVEIEILLFTLYGSIDLRYSSLRHPFIFIYFECKLLSLSIGIETDLRTFLSCVLGKKKRFFFSLLLFWNFGS